MYASLAQPPAPVRVPSQWLFFPHVTTVTNEKGDNEVKSGTVHTSPGINLTTEEIH